MTGRHDQHIFLGQRRQCGTQRGGEAILKEARQRGHALSVVGVPKTIDNDVAFVSRTFGYVTAVEEAVKAINCAHTEAHSVHNGISVVKIMGRHAGFIAAGATIASQDVNFTLVPEVPFVLDGEDGFTGGVKYFYDHWNVRWCAIGAMNLVFAGYALLPALWVYHLACLALLWYGWYRVITNAGWLNGAPRMQTVIISGCTTIAFFFSCFSISDVFFWINTSTMYLLSVIALLHAAASIIGHRNRALSSAVVVLCGWSIGGACEPFTLVLVLACAVLLLLQKKMKLSPPLHYSLILLFMICLCLSFAVTYSGEGHVIRAQYLPQTRITYKFWVFLKSYAKMILIKYPSVLLPVLLFSFPWYVFGRHYRLPALNQRNLKVVTLLFLTLTAFSLAPVVYVMSESGPERAWTQVSLYLTIYCAFVSAFAGAQSKTGLPPAFMNKVYGTLTVLFLLAAFVPKVRMAAVYAESYDQRMAFLIRQKETSEVTVVKVSPLLPSGWLHSAEITTDSLHYTNRHLKRYLKTEFSIVAGK